MREGCNSEKAVTVAGMRKAVEPKTHMITAPRV